MPTDASSLRIKLRSDQVAGLKRVAAARGIEPGMLMPEILKAYKAARRQQPVTIGSPSAAGPAGAPAPGGEVGQALVSDALDWWLALPQNQPV